MFLLRVGRGRLEAVAVCTFSLPPLAGCSVNWWQIPRPPAFPLPGWPACPSLALQFTAPSSWLSRRCSNSEGIPAAHPALLEGRLIPPTRPSDRTLGDGHAEAARERQRASAGQRQDKTSPQAHRIASLQRRGIVREASLFNR